MHWKRIRKLIGSLLGAVTGGAVVGVARLFGVELEPELVGLIVAVCSALGTYLAPPNEESPDDGPMKGGGGDDAHLPERGVAGVD
jgi:hypothetical protein